MSKLLRELHAEAKAADAEYQEAYAAYLHAEPGRDLTIKQGLMQRLRARYNLAVHAFFEEYEKSGIL